MKKFSKVLTGVLSALLLTVGGVNFTSCSNDDGDTPKNPSLTIAAEASEGQVTAGGVITTTITATLKDTTFKGPIAKDASLNAYVDITYSGDTDFVGDPTLTAVEAIANGATVAKVKLVQTAAAVTEEKSGTISVKIKASALASGKDLTAGNKLPYKISAATPTPAPAASGTTFTLDAATQTAADSITSGTEYASAEDASFKFAFLGTACKIDGDPQRFNFSGKLSKDVAAENKGCIAFTAKAGDVVKVYYYSTNAGRYPQLATKAKAKVAIESASTKPTTADATLYDYTFAAITADGDYVVGAGADTAGGVWVTKIVITRN